VDRLTKGGPLTDPPGLRAAWPNIARQIADEDGAVANIPRTQWAVWVEFPSPLSWRRPGVLEGMVAIAFGLVIMTATLASILSATTKP